MSAISQGIRNKKRDKIEDLGSIEVKGKSTVDDDLTWGTGSNYDDVIKKNANKVIKTDNSGKVDKKNGLWKSFVKTIASSGIDNPYMVGADERAEQVENMANKAVDKARKVVSSAGDVVDKIKKRTAAILRPGVEGAGAWGRKDLSPHKKDDYPELVLDYRKEKKVREDKPSKPKKVRGYKGAAAKTTGKGERAGLGPRDKISMIKGRRKPTKSRGYTGTKDTRVKGPTLDEVKDKAGVWWDIADPYNGGNDAKLESIENTYNKIKKAFRPSAKGKGPGLGKRKGQARDTKKSSGLARGSDKVNVNILRTKGKAVQVPGGSHRAGTAIKYTGSPKPVGRMKRVGGTDRLPKYEKVKYDPLDESTYIKTEGKPKVRTGSHRFSSGGRPTGQGFGIARFNRGGPAKNRVLY